MIKWFIKINHHINQNQYLYISSKILVSGIKKHNTKHVLVSWRFRATCFINKDYYFFFLRNIFKISDLQKVYNSFIVIAFYIIDFVANQTFVCHQLTLVHFLSLKWSRPLMFWAPTWHTLLHWINLLLPEIQRWYLSLKKKSTNIDKKKVGHNVYYDNTR